MVDRISEEQRSWIMSRVKSKNTKPEMVVRSLLHKMGYRFRLHVKDLPGKPDIVLPKYKTVIFVNGCFWHRHEGCRRSSMPQVKTEYWIKKFDKTKARDLINYQMLTKLGWNIIIIWECETSNKLELMANLTPNIVT